MVLKQPFSRQYYTIHGLYPGNTVTNRPVRGARRVHEALWEVPSPLQPLLVGEMRI